MYTILVTQDNELITSVRERIMQRSKLVDSLHFLVDPVYKELDMTDFTVVLEYITPKSREYRTELLRRSTELHKGKLEYKLPFDTFLTKEAGNIEVQMSFTKVDLDADGNNIQYVRKTSTANVVIVPISAWSDFVRDDALNAMDALALQLEGYMKYNEEIAEIYNNEKADNIKLDKETGEVYLVGNGNKLGQPISLEELSDAVAENAQNGLVTVIV